MIETRIPSGSVEFVHATVTVTDDQDPGGTVLAGLTVVALAITDTGAHTWLTGTWTGAATARTLNPGGEVVWDRPCRTSSVVDFGPIAQGSYTLYVRPAATPEAPILQAGTITVV